MPRLTDELSPRFGTYATIPYAVGLVCVSACAPGDLPIAQVEAEVDAQVPTGLNHGWKLSADSHFAEGSPNPCPCNQEGSTRLHYLLEC